jgi:hypothetical protein
MARIIPNENTWIGFLADTTPLADPSAPSVANVAAAINLTAFCISLNASARGNTVPTPSFDSLFETSTAGTSAATFDADFYRDDEEDTAWESLYRGRRGHFIIARFGFSGPASASASSTPVTGDDCEVWPVMITSRTMANMSSNTVLTFTASCAVMEEPAEDATVAA